MAAGEAMTSGEYAPLAKLVPEALEDEWGERWWAEGHHEPALMVLAVVREQMVNVGPQEAFDLLTGGKTQYAADRPRRTYEDQDRDTNRLFGQVRHIWLRYDEDDDEVMHRCEPTDAGAEPFTLLDLSLDPDWQATQSARSSDDG